MNFNKSNVYGGARRLVLHSLQSDEGSFQRSPGLKSAVCSLRSKVCRSQAAGFTLLELLIVITVMGILMALLLPAFSKVREGAREKQADIEIKIIDAAIAAYKLQERGQLPAAAGVYVAGANGNRVVMGELLNAEPPVLDANRLRWDNQGNVLNPWGNPYSIEILDGGSGGFRNDASTFYTEVVYSGMP